MDSRNEFIDTELFINAVENENAICRLENKYKAMTRTITRVC